MLKYKSNGNRVASGHRQIYVTADGRMLMMTDRTEADPNDWTEVFLDAAASPPEPLPEPEPSPNQAPVGADTSFDFEVKS